VLNHYLGSGIISYLIYKVNPKCMVVPILWPQGTTVSQLLSLRGGQARLEPDGAE
jgi:hypothetical protein